MYMYTVYSLSHCLLVYLLGMDLKNETKVRAYLCMFTYDHIRFLQIEPCSNKN